jgi:hypothetical protein
MLHTWPSNGQRIHRNRNEELHDFPRDRRPKSNSGTAVNPAVFFAGLSFRGLVNLIHEIRPELELTS